MRLLVVEDDRDLNRQVVSALEEAGYAVDKAFDGEEGAFLGETEPYDCIILDMGLPKADGVSVLSGWRRAQVKTPVIILTARDRWSDKVNGFDAGADDYVTKPFHMEELLARVRALLRRAKPAHVADLLVAGDIELDRVSHRVRRDGRELHLGPTEFKLLEFLMQSPGRVFSREQLLDGVWGHDVYIDERTVDVHIGRLRKAINRGRDTDPIRTVRGSGYSFDEMFAPEP